MDTLSQPQTFTSQQAAVVLGTVVVITLAASHAALWGTSEQSERGFRLLKWLDKLWKTEDSSAESGL
ncbi:hypothetical protein [Streptomyces sp. NBC_00069]|uniref:hypothetical protein n=1 Tax=Streptomyces sp. NBC_00069 TaxID=2975639 RepID=UPI00324CA442